MVNLSIIVPIYNVEQYLRKCVFLLIHQNLRDYEILLVDDGSTDESGKICDELCETINDERLTIRVIHQENGGLSAARNAGLKVARGEYVMFVDSDDYLEPNVLGKLIKTMEEKQLDVLRFNYQNVRLVTDEGMNGLTDEWKYEVFEPFKTGKPYFDYSEGVLDGEAFLNERLGYACYAVMFVIKRSLLVTSEGLTNERVNECLFTEGIYFEDTDWTPRMLMRAKRVSSTPMIVYNYLWREGSITLPDNPVKRKKVLDDKMRLINGFIERQKQVKDKRWFEWQIAGTTMSILEMLSTYPAKERESYISQLQDQHIFPLTMYRAVGNNKYKIRMANVSPALYCRLLSAVRRMKR